MTERERTDEQRVGRKIQFSKKKNAVTFIGYLAGERVFCLRTKQGGSKKLVLRGEVCTIDDGKSYCLTEEQLQRLNAAQAQFDLDFGTARQGGGGFLCARSDGETRYARPLAGGEYHFFAESANGDVRQKKGTVNEYLTDYFDLRLILPFRGRDFEAEERDRAAYRRREDALLTALGDNFIACEIKYLNDLASREEVEFLIRSDGKPRFFKQKEVYGTEDVRLLNAQPIPRSFFHPSLQYRITVEIDGMQFRTFYHWNSDRLSVKGEAKSTCIAISGELKEHIRVFTGGDEVLRNKHWW